MKLLVPITLLLFLGTVGTILGQSDFSKMMYEIAEAPSPNNLESYVKKLVSFGTRHTLSDTTSTNRGIGAARRWIKSEFENIAGECGGCLEVFYNKGLALASENSRMPADTWIVNVVAIQRGTKYPNRYIIMAGGI